MEWVGPSENAAGNFGNHIRVSGGQLDKKTFYFILLQRFVYSFTGYDSIFCIFNPSAERALESSCFNLET